MRIAVIDARDSFVHIVAELLRSDGVDARVVRPDMEDAQTALEALRPDALILGPGPGHPAESCHMELVRLHLGRIPMLGICLGHQAIGLHYGWSVALAPRPEHGKQWKITHDGQGLFAGLPSPMTVTRYHSLVVVPCEGPSPLVVSTRAGDGTVMGLRHRSLPAWGVQFHPESYGTQAGAQLLRNFCRLAMEAGRDVKAPLEAPQACL